MTLQVQRFTQLPPDLPRLAQIAHEEGFFMLDKLIERFESGQNCFDKPGEALFAVEQDSELLGIGGLNIDPYFDDPALGRVRHLYVHPSARRQGVGRMITEAIENHAVGRFAQLQLFTPTEAASRFYESLGYLPAREEGRISHSKPIPDKSPLSRG